MPDYTNTAQVTVPSYYDIAIVASGLSVTGNAVGFIDAFTVQQWWVGNGNVYPSTLATSLNKASANMRWDNILAQCSTTISPRYVLDYVNTGGSVDTPPTAIGFTLVYENSAYLTTPDELTPGTFITTDTLCIKRFIARALINQIELNAFIIDPTLQGGFMKNGPQMYDLIAAPLATGGSVSANIATANASITVTAIAKT